MESSEASSQWLYVGMKQIADRGGDPLVFLLGRFDGGLWLRDYWASPGYRWYPNYRFVFGLRKSEPQTLQPSGFFDKLFKR